MPSPSHFPRPSSDVPTGAKQLWKIKRADGGMDCVAFFEAEQPLTPKQLEKPADLKNRLELSVVYEKKEESVERALGIPSAERGMTKVLRAMWRIEKDILKLPAEKPADTQIKIALYDRIRQNDPDGTRLQAESIIRDLRRPLKQQKAAA
jgi:hypothetical protein